MGVFPERFTIGVKSYSASGDDGFGNPVESWGSPVSTPVYAVAPGTPGEDYEPGRTPSRIPLVVLGSSDSIGSVRARDRVVWQGLEFEVDGEPESFDCGPFGFTPGVRLRIIRVEG